MARRLSFAGKTGPLAYLIAAPTLLLVQPLTVLLIIGRQVPGLAHESVFWVLPLRRLAQWPGLTAAQAAIAFAVSLAASGMLALLSFRRARWSGGGMFVAMLTLVPGVQGPAAAYIACVPRLAMPNEDGPDSGRDTAHIIEGVIAGIAIIVLAVLISALSFGTYGWGLFVMTPFLVGVTTAYLANRRLLLSAGQTASIVLSAATLGTIALVMFALEGFVCILLASPLCAGAALFGGAIGRGIASVGHRRGRPMLSVAVLPALFALEAAMPPFVPIATHEAIEVNAPPAAVWTALTSGAPIGRGPGLIGLAGLAYPVRGRLLGSGVGAIRLGDFSTGTARERVTAWVPGQRLTFAILHQPPAMEEMSPYRHVHAPHLNGYFTTGDTTFSLVALPGGRTRLAVDATHVLRIDPALYWEPLAKLAIRLNVSRVLEDVRDKAEQDTPRHGRRTASDSSQLRLRSGGSGS